MFERLGGEKLLRVGEILAATRSACFRQAGGPHTGFKPRPDPPNSPDPLDCRHALTTNQNRETRQFLYRLYTRLSPDQGTEACLVCQRSSVSLSACVSFDPPSLAPKLTRHTNGSALLNAKFQSGPMGLTKFSSEAQEASWQEAQDQVPSV